MRKRRMVGWLAALAVLALPVGAWGYELLSTAVSPLGGQAAGNNHSIGFTAGLPVVGQMERTGSETFAGFWFPEIGVATDVGHDGEPVLLPNVTRLDGSAPNPFRPETQLSFQIAQDADGATVRLRVFDVSGRSIRSLVDGSLSAGTHRVTWDGRDNSGKRVASGVYFARLEAPNYSKQIRLVATR